VAYLKPGFVVSRVVNPVARIAATSLKVRKRKSGGLQVIPVNVLQHDGARYLVAPRGETEWVRNLRAAGGAAQLSRLGKSERIHATEVPRGERTPIVDAYVQKWGYAVGSQFEDIPDPEDHPAFRIDAA
jgi:hypothetical protein